MSTPDTSHRGFGKLALLLAALAGAAGALAVRSGSAPVAHAEEAQRWHCPMHPTVIRDQPGSCPICGMTLVTTSPIVTSPAVNAAAGVNIEPARQQLIGISTAIAERGEVGRQWRTTGTLAIDERRVRRVSIKVGGFVQKVFVDYVGKPVRKGDPLFSFYSPELYAAEDEFLVAMRTRRALPGDGADLVSAARRKLELWDLSERDIARLESTGVAQRTVTVYAPCAGVALKKDVVEGMRLEAGAMPYELVDLGHLWVLADVSESDLHLVKKGLHASLQLKAFPSHPFEAEVTFIDPLLDPKTRTVKVRLELPNPEGELRPEMFGEVTFRTESRVALRVPSDAVIDSGARKRVFVALGQGRFEPREVTVGDDDGTHTEIVYGLAEGEQVVTRANFFVDSESRLKSALAPDAQAHGGM